jgi:hypothetical protein
MRLWPRAVAHAHATGQAESTMRRRRGEAGERVPGAIAARAAISALVSILAGDDNEGALTETFDLKCPCVLSFVSTGALSA